MTKIRRLTQFMAMDACATAVALLALTGTVAVTTASPIARAQSGAAAVVSAVAGVPLPKGAAGYSKANGNFTRALTALAGDEKVKREPVGDAAQVYVWQGDDFREDRYPFMRTALRKSLAAAGYVVQEIAAADVAFNIFESFPPEEENLPFHIDLAKPRFYFVAQNEARSQTFVGAWMQSENRLALALLPVAFKATPKAVPLPDVKAGAGVVLVKDINDTMKGIALPKAPVFPAVARKPNTVRGLVKDGAGRPIAGARIAVYSSAGGGFRTTHSGVSNAQGAYQITLPVGVGEVAEATCKLPYNGEIYELPLKQVGEEGVTFNGKDGYVANFVLQTWGEYGATLRVLDNVEKGTLELTFTPEGRLLDGTVGRVFVYRYDASVSSESYLNGLPLGRYNLTARLLDDGEALPLRVGNTFGSEAERELKDSLQINFKPGFTYSQYNRGKSNSKIQHFDVMLAP